MLCDLGFQARTADCNALDSSQNLDFPPFRGVNLRYWQILTLAKGQLISKANCQTMNSSKKLTNEFVFTSRRHVFVLFLENGMVQKGISKLSDL